MNTPILANPLDQAEKQSIFENISNDVSEKEIINKYIDLFIQKNNLKNYEPNDISKRKFLASLVFAIAVFLEIAYFALYHNSFTIILILVETIFYVIFFRKHSLRKYLLREIMLRPDDNIDNILISQVSGAQNSFINKITSRAPLLIALLISALLFMRPHMIFEKNSAEGYSLRYYTLALIPEKKVIIPNTHKGKPVNSIRGNVFQNMSSVKYIILPSELSEIRGYTFDKCRGLEKIEIPEGVTRIGGHAFYGCKSLKKVIVPSTVTEIRSSAFRNCYSLECIEIPKNAHVDQKVFKNSPTDIYFY